MLMSALSPKARDVVRAGRALNRPTAADQQRIQGALSERLGIGLSFIEPSPPVVRPQRQVLTGALMGAGVIGAVLFAAQPGPVAPSLPLPSLKMRAPVPTAAAAPLRPDAQAPASTPRARAPIATALARAPTAPAVASVTAAPVARATDRLGEEVALLTRATSSLHTGRPGQALEMLEEHRRRFPDGVLSEERHAARAEALCALARRGEGMAELSGVRSQSATAEHARQFCAAGSTRER